MSLHASSTLSTQQEQFVEGCCPQHPRKTLRYMPCMMRSFTTHELASVQKLSKLFEQQKYSHSLARTVSRYAEAAANFERAISGQFDVLLLAPEAESDKLELQSVGSNLQQCVSEPTMLVDAKAI
eukprot:4905792-Amphidinium_carterae.1